jgi:hypothetical protein
MLVDSRVPHRDEVRSTVSERVRAELAQCTAAPFWDTSADQRDLLYVWKLSDQDAVRQFLRDATERAGWDLADVVNWIITRHASPEDGRVRYEWSETKQRELDEFIGFEHVLTTLADRIAGARTPYVTANADTPADRREAALQALYVVRTRPPQ